MKCPVNASCRALILARIRVRASCARTEGSRSPAISAASIARPDTPKMSLATTDSLMPASSRSFSARCFSAVRAADQVDPVPGDIPQPPDRRRGHETGPDHLPLGDLAQPHRVEFIGLRTARQVLTSRALASQVSNPCASSTHNTGFQ